MRLQQLKCPNCEGTLELKVQGDKEIFCPYCGQAFLPEENAFTYNENKNINKKYNLSFGHQKTDNQINKEAELEMLKEENRMTAWKFKMLFLLIIIALGLLFFTLLVLYG